MGQVRFRGEETPQIRTVDIAAGVATLANDTDNSALRYYDLPAVPLAIADNRLPTDGALLEVTVKAADSPG